ncbi:hypothetical protein AV521_10555 [Streptomyces sp. IMTB 2501]|uniref:hypothetical protein n=1 Tax=Streptomyces sp. IMTB 2501 TaxID=1776340 RepID=UPI00096CF2E3|nr:hypothetical protein [Streptomyces sp. IMTB 2501]OLZ71392.1 hypothetical protein AV521_10555 [Streptomyces sp. IMTB 2501]
MITKVSHEIAVRGPADIVLALSVTRDLHAPVPAPREPEPASRAPKPAPRAPEVAAATFPELMGLRTSATRSRRRKVPLNRLTAVRA